MVEKSKGLAGADGPALRVAPAAGCCSSAGEGSSVLTVAVFSSAQTTPVKLSLLQLFNSAQIAHARKEKKRKGERFLTDLEQPCRRRPGRKQALALLPLVSDEPAEDDDKVLLWRGGNARATNQRCPPCGFVFIGEGCISA